MKTKNIKRRLSIWAAIVGAILMIPYLTKAPWSSGDYVFAGLVLFGCASIYEMATKNMSNKMHRIAIAVAVLGLIVLIQAWAVAGPD